MGLYFGTDGHMALAYISHRCLCNKKIIALKVWCKVNITQLSLPRITILLHMRALLAGDTGERDSDDENVVPFSCRLY